MITIELIIVLVSSVLIGVLLGFLLFQFGRNPKLPDLSMNIGGGSRREDEISDDLLRIFQRGVGYPLLIEVGNRRYRTIADIEDEGNRALVVAAVRKLLTQVSPEELSEAEYVQEDVDTVEPVQPAPTSAPAQLGNNGGSQRMESPYFLINEIDELFQSVLETMPDVPEASLTPAPDGSMRIRFNGRVYDDVSAVPNAKVQEAIRTAVEQWESRV